MSALSMSDLAAKLDAQAIAHRDDEFDALAAAYDARTNAAVTATALRELSAELEGPRSPTSADPMRGLVHLAKVALLGRANILEQASRPVTYIWQDIAVPATIVLLAGNSGDGKTTLLFLIVAARASVTDAVDLLGRRVTPAPAGHFIVILEGEHAEGSTCRKLVKSMAALAIDDAALDRVIVVARKAVHVGSPEWTDVVSLIRAGLVSDLVIDTVARVMPGDGSSEREQVALFDKVAQAIDAAPNVDDRPIVWAVAHTKKNGQTGELSDVSGSVQRVGQADSVLLLRAERGEDGRVLSSTVTFAKLREDPDEYPAAASFSIVRDADGAWRVTTDTSATVARGKGADGVSETEVLAVLGDVDTALTTSKIRGFVSVARGGKAGSKVNKAGVDRVLGAMEKRGAVSRAEIPWRNGVMEGWVLGAGGGTFAAVPIAAPARAEKPRHPVVQYDLADHVNRDGGY